jgi:hypothetical protein
MTLMVTMAMAVSIFGLSASQCWLLVEIALKWIGIIFFLPSDYFFPLLTTIYKFWGEKTL